MWRRVRISEAAEIVSGGTPSRTNPSYWGGDVPWATPTDITSCPGVMISSTEESITLEGLRNSSAALLPAGSILLTSRATIGEARITAVDICTNQGFKSLVARNGFDNEFLYYQISRIRPEIERFAVGSTFLEINKKDLSRIKLECPVEVTEQRQIARILRAVDAQIERTEKLSAKLSQVLAGLMQDLLTRGIDESGRLRPSREEAPQLYHKGASGWLPRVWGSMRIDQIVDPQRPVVYGILMPGKDYPDGVPVVKVKDIRSGRIETSGLLRTSPRIDAEYARSRLKSGDLLLTIRGTVGRIAMVPDELEGANITQDTARISVSTGVAAFFRYFLESDRASSFFESNTLGNAVQGINLRDVRRMAVPIPPAPEQQEIALRLDSARATVAALKSEKGKLSSLKSGLMQSMLSAETLLLGESAA